MRLITTRITTVSPLAVALQGVSLPVAAVVSADPTALVAALASGDRVVVIAQPGENRTTTLTLLGKVIDL